MNKLQGDILYLIQCKKSINAICSELAITKDRLLSELRKISDGGTPIDVIDGEILTFKWPERVKTPYVMPLDKSHVKIALLGDTHLASKYDDLYSLNKAYDLADIKQVDAVFHSGDLVDGLVSVPDYQKELKEDTYYGQLEYVIDRYPKYNGKTFAVSGNHDDYWYRLTGKEIIKDVADRRDDIEYLGSSRRIVEINGLRINVLHGKFVRENRIGDIYSYIDNIPDDKKPDIVHSGHYHTGDIIDYNGVKMFRSGSFMKETPRDIRKGHHRDNSTYFVDVYYDDDGNVAEITHEKKSFRK